MNSFSFVASAAFLFVTSLAISPSCAIPQDVLATICSQTQNQEACESWLKKDPRTATADLPLLSEISLELAIKQADQNYESFLSFRDNSTEAALKVSFGTCVRLYQDMQDKLKVAYQFSQNRQYRNITELGRLATLSYVCENGLPSNSPTAGITEDMLLAGQTAVYVNQYVSDHIV